MLSPYFSLLSNFHSLKGKKLPIQILFHRLVFPLLVVFARLSLVHAPASSSALSTCLRSASSSESSERGSVSQAKLTQLYITLYVALRRYSFLFLNFFPPWNRANPRYAWMHAQAPESNLRFWGVRCATDVPWKQRHSLQARVAKESGDHQVSDSHLHYN